jgi:hypothetical protein
MSVQLDMFKHNPLLGQHVKLDRPIDRERPCHGNICSIGPGKAPHAGELLCAQCGRHRGWLSKATAGWIESVVSRFGAPTSPIVVRRAHSYQEERTNIPLPTAAD